MTIAHHHLTRVSRVAAIAAVAVGVLASAAAGSSTSPRHTPRSKACPQVEFAPSSDNIAYDIRTVGVTCSAGHAIVKASAPTNLRPGPNRSYRAGAFDCRGTFVRPTGKWYERYVCRHGRSTVAFNRG
jgi:hypothetical protein